MSLYTTARILVADDQELNRALLRDLLESQGHTVVEAVDGEDTLRRVASDAPDLLLLDVAMPRLDGFEVCRRLKAVKETAAIPILLVTALTGREERLKGIEAGANDYVTKPIDKSELALRVRSALQLRRLYTELELQYRRLKDLEDLRDQLVHLLVHDLRTPLQGIRMYLGILREDVAAVRDPAEFVELIDQANAVASRMTEMVSDMLDVSRLEERAMPLTLEETDLTALVEDAIMVVGADGKQKTVQVVTPERPVRANCDPGLIRRVIANLVGNAVDFSPPGRTVVVRVEETKAGPGVSVRDDGPGIPAELHEAVFAKFAQAYPPRQRFKRSSGLGLTFCKLAVEAHGGRIGVTSAVGAGSTFWFVLPRAVSAVAAG